MCGYFIFLFFTGPLVVNPVTVQPPNFWQHTAVSFSYYCLLTALYPEVFWSLGVWPSTQRTEELPGWSAQQLWRVWEPAVPPQLALNQTYSIKGWIMALN